MRSHSPRRCVITAVASALTLSLVALSTAACSSHAADADTLQTATSGASGSSLDADTADQQHASNSLSMTGNTVVNTGAHAAEPQQSGGQGTGEPPGSGTTQRDAASGPAGSTGGSKTSALTSTASTPSTPKTASLPGGILDGKLLVNPTWLNDEQLAFPDATAAAGSGSNSDLSSALGAAFCAFLFGTPEQVGTLTRLPGAVSLDPISGYKTHALGDSVAADGAADGAADDRGAGDSGAGDSGAADSAAGDSNDANGARTDASTDASTDENPGASDRTSSYVCLYDADEAQTLALQVTNGPPLDPDLPGSPIIVISGSIQAVLSYAPDYTGRTISTDTARDWLSQAAQRVKQSAVPGQ